MNKQSKCKRVTQALSMCLLLFGVIANAKEKGDIFFSDNFSTLNGWREGHSKDVSMKITNPDSPDGKSVKIDFTYGKKNKGWAVYKKSVDFIPADRYYVKIRMKSSGGPAHFVLGIADEKKITYRKRCLGLIQDSEWHDVIIYSEHIKFGWKPQKPKRIVNISFAINPSDTVKGPVSGSFSIGEIEFIKRPPVGTLPNKPSFAKIFSDNMVLQRGKNIPMWGFASDGTKVTLEFNGEKQDTLAKDGKWQVKFPPMSHGGPYKMSLTSSTCNTILKNVMIGDVWLVSGQSNMQWAIASTLNSVKIMKDANNHKNIRLFKVNLSTSKTELRDLDQMRSDSWKVSSPTNVADFSAVGYLFGCELRKYHSNIPVGIIMSAKGGSAIQPWLIADLVQKNKNLKNINLWQLGTRYNAMIKPLIPFAIKGTVWYQGESNTKTKNEAFLYRSMLKELITSWRDAWKDEFPFITIQLPNFKKRLNKPSESNWAEMRESQATSLEGPKTGLVCLIDAGEADNIHPKNKEIVADRLILVAEKVAYGKEIVCYGPTYSSMKIGGDKIILTFDNIGGGLVQKTASLDGFAIAGKDKVFKWAKAKIDGNRVIIWNDQISKPIAARYAWADNPVSSLYNKEGLPALPFRSNE